MQIRMQAACFTIFALSTFALSAQCGGIDGGTPGKPFQAEFHCRDVQTLLDGTQIVEERFGLEARDAQGRGYVEQPFGPNSPVSIYVSDSAQGTTTAWFIAPKAGKDGQEPNTSVLLHKTAKLWHFPPVATQPTTADQAKADVLAAMCPVQQRNELTCEDLGTRTISGIVGYGTREHRTVPAGEYGNDRSFVITYERWYSPEMKLLLSATTNDPRTGEHTAVLENIDRTEPPASLFEVPEGYTLVEQARDQ
jgi:hypothetical protein